MADIVKKEYGNKEITVVWQPHLCIHSTNCWKGLIKVFNPAHKPWINMSGASSKEIIHQVNQCPSGALSFYLNEDDEEKIAEPNIPTVKLMKNGPLIFEHGINLRFPDGELLNKSGKVALCRCGQSQNKPFCDGSHSKSGFQDS